MYSIVEIQRLDDALTYGSPEFYFISRVITIWIYP